LVPGISLVIRAKNEELNVKFCIESVIDLVDEIIFVDNGSTDNTYNAVKEYTKKYNNIKLYKYNIAVSRAGVAHKEALQNGNPNTLGLFYNWCLSKCTRYNVFKWDADFLCIRNNFIDLVNKYNVRKREDKFAIWFTGLTLFENNNNYYVNYNSFYDEFRIYSYKNGFKWSDGEICEYKC
jgi:glycosyltransferase involved in cell wall biosynthesis